MKRVFGLETEYGITVSGARNGRCGGGVDRAGSALHRSRRLHEMGLRPGGSASRRARISRRELLQDTDESAYYEIDKNRPLSFEEIKSDLVLSNGARFYNDHAHPEYSTPECTTLRQIVTQDKAGERILAECARRRNQKLPSGQEVRLYKNNTDFRRSQLRLPRQLSDETRCPVGPDRRRNSAVSDYAPNLRRRRQDGD